MNKIYLVITSLSLLLHCALPCNRLTIAFKGRMLSMSECSHILLYLMVGYLSINLCRTDIAVSEHLAECFH